VEKSEIKLEDNKRINLEEVNSEIKLTKKEEHAPEVTKENSNIVLSNNAPTVNSKPIDISTYNGDTNDMYNWSQGVTDVSIQIKLPPNTNWKLVSLNLV